MSFLNFSTSFITQNRWYHRKLTKQNEKLTKTQHRDLFDFMAFLEFPWESTKLFHSLYNFILNGDIFALLPIEYFCFSQKQKTIAYSIFYLFFIQFWYRFTWKANDMSKDKYMWVCDTLIELFHRNDICSTETVKLWIK